MRLKKPISGKGNPIFGIGFFGGDMLKIAVCDDEEWIRQYIGDIIYKELCIKADLYTDGTALLASDVAYDIYFLDIYFGKEGSAGQINGMETAKKLRARTDAVIIFITAIKDFVFEAYDVEAFWYLLKPSEEQKLVEVIKKAAARAGRRQEQLPLLIKADGRNLKIPVSDIYYGENDGRKIILHTKNGTYTYYEKMEQLEQKLGDGFFRSHRGFLVSLKEVEGYDRISITLKCGDTVFLAKQKYGDFVKAYMDFLTQKTLY